MSRTPLSFLQALTPLAALVPALVPVPVLAFRAQTFDASFESGNLRTVTELGPDRYGIEVGPDTDSTQRQWFYFSVADAAGRTLTIDVAPFDIVAPWANGMTPCVTDDPDDPTAWHRIDPSHTSWRRGGLTFTWSFTDDDPIWFAYSYAYPYRRVQALVEELAGSPHAMRTTIGRTLMGRPLETLEITQGSLPDKVGIWVQARQHPAECGASWTCEGFLRWLLGPSDEARAVRERSVVRVLPMVNPDGVVAGNYRTNAAGLDLNRQWESANAVESPEVAAVLDELARLDAEHGLEYFIDLHTHSSERKTWVYGVSGSTAFDARERGYARVLESVDPDFSFTRSSFSNARTGRVAKNRIHQLYPDALSYTHEQTYDALTYGPNAGAPVTIERYVRMGESVGLAIARFEGWSPSWSESCVAPVDLHDSELAMHATGSPRASGPDDFHVVATGVSNRGLGIYVWGLAPVGTPWLDGTLDLGAAAQRALWSGGSTGPLESSGQWDFHWTQASLAAHGLLPGTVVHGGFWSREPRPSEVSRVNLTAGLRFTVHP